VEWEELAQLVSAQFRVCVVSVRATQYRDRHLGEQNRRISGADLIEDLFPPIFDESRMKAQFQAHQTLHPLRSDASLQGN
jgi:hypothetical protein